MNIKELAELISKSVKMTFTEPRERYGKDQLIGYSIVSHDTADSCFLTVATKNGCEEFEHGSDSDFLFSPVEWDGVCENSFFSNVNEKLVELYDLGDYVQDPDWHNKFREFIFESHVRGLELLIDEGFFGTEADRDNIYIAFSLSDSETSKTHLPTWVKRLNTQSVCASYLSRNNV